MEDKLKAKISKITDERIDLITELEINSDTVFHLLIIKEIDKRTAQIDILNELLTEL